MSEIELLIQWNKIKTKVTQTYPDTTSKEMIHFDIYWTLKNRVLKANSTLRKLGELWERLNPTNATRRYTIRPIRRMPHDAIVSPPANANKELPPLIPVMFPPANTSNIPHR